MDLEREFLEDVLVAEGGFLEAGDALALIQTSYSNKWAESFIEDN